MSQFEEFDGQGLLSCAWFSSRIFLSLFNREVRVEVVVVRGPTASICGMLGILIAADKQEHMFVVQLFCE